jgi:ATP-dependent protease ClpP protease subunit
MRDHQPVWRPLRKTGASRNGSKAEAARDRRARVVEVMAAATGQSEDQVETDLSDRRAFDGEDAQAYGLVERVVQSRREVF